MPRYVVRVCRRTGDPFDTMQIATVDAHDPHAAIQEALSRYPEDARLVDLHLESAWKKRAKKNLRSSK